MTVTVFGFAFVDVSFLLFVILFLVCNCWWLVIACCIAYFIVCVTVNVGNAWIIPDNRHVGVESGHQSSTARSAKAHLGSKGHSLLSLQTTRALDGIRTGQKNMVGTFWLFLQLLHGLK